MFFNCYQIMWLTGLLRILASNFLSAETQHAAKSSKQIGVRVICVAWCRWSPAFNLTAAPETQCLPSLCVPLSVAHFLSISKQGKDIGNSILHNLFWSGQTHMSLYVTYTHTHTLSLSLSLSLVFFCFSLTIYLYL
jgi:hypothetical protein